MIQELESAADALAQARLVAGEHAELLGAATAEHANLLERIQSKEAERSAIISARSRGDNSPDHAGRLTLLAADIEGLGQLIANDQAKVVAAKAKSQASNSALASAEQQFARAEDDATLVRLIEHADAVGLVLTETAGEIVALCKKLGQRTRWAPSRELSDSIRRLDLNRAGAV